MKSIIITFFLVFAVSDSNTPNKEEFLPPCEGSACNAVKLYWSESENGYIFENRNHPDSEKHQIGNTILLEVKHLTSKRAILGGCSAVTRKKLFYGKKWNAGDIGLCNNKPFKAEYENKKVKGDFKFK